MAETDTPAMNKLMYTVHSTKRPQGQLALVNCKMALAYIEKKQVIGYTYLDEIMQKACSGPLPEYKLDF